MMPAIAPATGIKMLLLPGVSEPVVLNADGAMNCPYMPVPVPTYR
jgi:hypothetical protein